MQALFLETEPGVGEEPADPKKARQLAKQILRNKALIALPFRQLWRHKYVEKNYDAAQAWRLFYWAATHDGAGGRGYNPATRKAAAKLVTAAFAKWASPDMKAKVKRADGIVELPIGDISRAEFVRWFLNAAPAVNEGVDFTLKDVQTYYDLQIASGQERKDAIRRTKRRFKLRELFVNPVGRVRVPGVPEPVPADTQEPEAPPKPQAARRPKVRYNGSMSGGRFPEGPNRFR